MVAVQCKSKADWDLAGSWALKVEAKNCFQWKKFSHEIFVLYQWIRFKSVSERLKLWLNGQILSKMKIVFMTTRCFTCISTNRPWRQSDLTFATTYQRRERHDWHQGSRYNVQEKNFGILKSLNLGPCWRTRILNLSKLSNLDWLTGMRLLLQSKVQKNNWILNKKNMNQLF